MAATSERSKRVALAAGSGQGALVLNALTYAISVPLLIHTLGAERFGAWLTLLQALTLVSTAIGWMAAPIVREVAGARLAEDSEHRQRRLIATTSLAYAVVAGVLVLGAAAVATVWLPSRPGLAGEVTAASAVVALTAALTLHIGLVSSVLAGYNRLHLTNLVMAAQSVLSTAGAVVAASLSPHLAVLAVGHLVGVGGAALVALWLSRGLRSGYFLRSEFDSATLRRLLTVGRGYLGYSLAFMATQTDLLAISWFLGPSHTAAYGVAARLFDYLLNLLRRLPDSVVPTIAELDAAGRTSEIATLQVWAARATTTAAALMATLLAMSAPTLLRLWLGGTVPTSGPVFVSLAGLTVVAAWVHASLVVPFATNRIAAVGQVLWVEASLKLLLLAIGLPLWGVLAAPLSGGAAVLLVSAWAVPLLAARVTGRSLGAFLRATSRLVPVLALAAVGWLLVAYYGDAPAIWWGVLGATTALLIPMAIFVSLSAAERRGVVALSRSMFASVR